MDKSERELNPRTRTQTSVLTYLKKKIEYLFLKTQIYKNMFHIRITSYSLVILEQLNIHHKFLINLFQEIIKIPSQILCSNKIGTSAYILVWFHPKKVTKIETDKLKRFHTDFRYLFTVSSMNQLFWNDFQKLFSLAIRTCHQCKIVVFPKIQPRVHPHLSYQLT